VRALCLVNKAIAEVVRDFIYKNYWFKYTYVSFFLFSSILSSPLLFSSSSHILIFSSHLIFSSRLFFSSHLLIPSSHLLFSSLLISSLLFSSLLISSLLFSSHLISSLLFSCLPSSFFYSSPTGQTYYLNERIFTK
jgi:hypothetical protein